MYALLNDLLRRGCILMWLFGSSFSLFWFRFSSSEAESANYRPPQQPWLKGPLGVWGSLSCPGGGSHCSIRIVVSYTVHYWWPPAPGWPRKSRKPVHDCTCLEAVISTLTKFTGRPPASFLPSPMCGKNVNLGAPTGIPHHRAGSSNRREQTTRGNAVFFFFFNFILFLNFT